MMMTRGSLAFLDTNILLAATDTGREGHQAALRVFEMLPAAGVHLALCGQILREYLVVATRPMDADGLGMDLHLALENIEEIRSRCVFLDETDESLQILMDIVRDRQIRGKRTHDANVAAMMISSGVSTVVTYNTRDFSEFPGITAVTPEESGA